MWSGEFLFLTRWIPFSFRGTMAAPVHFYKGFNKKENVDVDIRKLSHEEINICMFPNLWRQTSLPNPQTEAELLDSTFWTCTGMTGLQCWIFLLHNCNLSQWGCSMLLQWLVWHFSTFLEVLKCFTVRVPFTHKQIFTHWWQVEIWLPHWPVCFLCSEIWDFQISPWNVSMDILTYVLPEEDILFLFSLKKQMSICWFWFLQLWVELRMAALWRGRRMFSSTIEQNSSPPCGWHFVTDTDAGISGISASQCSA